MSFLAYCFILHLFVSMHACNSRHFDVFHKEPGNEFRLTCKITQRESKLEFLLIEQKMHKGSNGMQVDQKKTKLEGWNYHARSTKESKQEESAIRNSMDNSVSEDVVVMDYAQPHRKSPIHN